MVTRHSEHPQRCTATQAQGMKRKLELPRTSDSHITRDYQSTIVASIVGASVVGTSVGASVVGASVGGAPSSAAGASSSVGASVVAASVGGAFAGASVVGAFVAGASVVDASVAGASVGGAVGAGGGLGTGAIALAAAAAAAISQQQLSPFAAAMIPLSSMTGLGGALSCSITRGPGALSGSAFGPLCSCGSIALASSVGAEVGELCRR